MVTAFHQKTNFINRAGDRTFVDYLYAEHVIGWCNPIRS